MQDNDNYWIYGKIQALQSKCHRNKVKRHWQTHLIYTLFHVVAAELFVQQGFHILLQDWAFVFSLCGVEKTISFCPVFATATFFFVKK